MADNIHRKEILRGELFENVSQKYIAVCNEKNAVLIANDGVYGSSYDEKASSLKITLLRSPSYTAHPVGDRRVMPQDRYMPYIDIGERDFAFSLDAGERREILNSASRKAQHFGMPPMLLSFYPTGVGEKTADTPVMLTEDSPVTIQAFKKADDKKGYIVRLFNPTERPQRAKITILGKTQIFLFSPFEVKTIRVHDGGYEENDLLENLLINCK